MDESAGVAWLQRHLDYCVAPLLGERWILDIDSTVKPLYGHQEGAVVGCNPKKPAVPPLFITSPLIGELRLALDVEVAAGNERQACLSRFVVAFGSSWPGFFWAGDRWPCLLRGDNGFGNEAVMSRCEQEELPYLFKRSNQECPPFARESEG